MADPLPPNPPPPAPDDHAPKPRGYFNAAQLEELTAGEDTLAAALDPRHAPLLTSKRLAADWLDRYGLLLARARAKTTETGQGQDAGEAATLLVGGTQRTLVVALQAIQSARKQQRRMGELEEVAVDVSLDGYFIGARLNPNRATLLQNAEALIAKAKADALPGYDAPVIQTVQDALDAYREDKTTQHGAEEEQGEDRTNRDGLIAKVTAGRLAIQHAADAVWPYTNRNNRAIRKAFGLPQSRPQRG